MLCQITQVYCDLPFDAAQQPMPCASTLHRMSQFVDNVALELKQSFFTNTCPMTNAVFAVGQLLLMPHNMHTM